MSEWSTPGCEVALLTSACEATDVPIRERRYGRIVPALQRRAFFRIGGVSDVRIETGPAAMRA